MKKINKSTFVRSACAVLLLSFILCSCTDGQTDVTEADTTTAEESTYESTAPDTGAPDTEPEVTEPDTEPDTEPATEAETEPVTEPDIITNPLTGLEAKVDYSERRPVAIMINNVRTKVNGETVMTVQNGISNADVMYECIVEGGLTRLMMVVTDWETLPEIGSVRSSREYYLDFAANHNAIYVHAGGSEQAYREMKSRNVNRLDFVNKVNGVSLYAYNYRSQTHLDKGYLLEHTLMTTGELIAKGIAKMNYSTVMKSGFDSPLDFVAYGTERTPSGGAASYLMAVYSSGLSPYYKYSASEGVYYRWQYSAPHVDQANGKQLSFKNIIVLYCPTASTGDTAGHMDVITTGTGKGYYISNGGYEEITWSKAYEDAPLVLLDSDGNKLLINRGKTFFQVCESSQIDKTVIK